MKEPNDPDGSDGRSSKFDEFEKREQRILDRLDRADEIFDDLQAKKKKPEKITDALQEVFESADRKLREIFSQFTKPSEEQKQEQSMNRESLVRYLLSCSDEQLMAIRSEIDRILKERGSA